MSEFNWNKLLSAQRLGKQVASVDQSSFDSDYKRIITSPAFRRLQDKTQVFPLERNDFVHTRLTHSIEVAMLARQLVAYICDYNKCPDDFKNNREVISRIVENASLLHDIGNPPFGHFGEEIIRKWFEDHLSEHLERKRKDYQRKYKEELTLSFDYLDDFRNFEGNAQALRIVTKLHDFSGHFGMDLTSATLNTIIKYTRSASEEKTDNICDKKIGYFHSEREKFEEIVNNTGVNKSRHPLAFILEAADDIAYLTADIEDAIEKKVVTFQEVIDFIHEFISKEIIEDVINTLKEYEKVEPSRATSDEIRRKIGQYTYTKKIKKMSQLIDLYYQDIYLLQKNNVKINQNKFFSDIRLKMIAGCRFSFTNNYNDIMSGSYNKDLFSDSDSEGLHDMLSKFAIQHIFSDNKILKLEISGHTILTFLLNQFVPAVILPEPMSKLDKKVYSLISRRHREVYEQQKEKLDNDEKMSKEQKENELLYHRLLMVTDFISSMTDSYAHDIYLELSGCVNNSR